MPLAGIIGSLTRVLRAVTGVADGERLSPLLIGVYTYLGLIALVLVFAWVTGTPLECATGACRS